MDTWTAEKRKQGKGMRDNKAGYMVTPFAWGWAAAVVGSVTRVLLQWRFIASERQIISKAT